jgi:dGTPase
MASFSRETPSPREKAEAREMLLSPLAAKSKHHKGRAGEASHCPARTDFQIDCHRIVHSKAFRRLRGKTQVFLWPEGDHYRTRLTHCQEVSQIARTLARALDLNEDLTEAISLGHDLGHTPFGHAGEEVVKRLSPNGFRHEQQSLRVVEKLENDGRGLNLTLDVRDGIVHHSKGAGPMIPESGATLPATLEGQVVRLADVVAYVNHDLDDAIRAKVVVPEDLPPTIFEVLGRTHSERITTLVLDIVHHTDFDETPFIRMGETCLEAIEALRGFLYQHVYFNKRVLCEFDRARTLLEHLWRHFTDDMDRFYDQYWPSALRDGEPVDDVRDFIAGMTDAFAVNLHEKIFTPRRWYIL